ncbi:HNH endonuclease [Streptomyces zaomyceticus]|uniref:HNH endonuclease n=1 Tax=Streptomyces zaomyceticus TaxID=68286 RepID=UPI0034297233
MTCRSCGDSIDRALCPDGFCTPGCRQWHARCGLTEAEIAEQIATSLEIQEFWSGATVDYSVECGACAAIFYTTVESKKYCDDRCQMRAYNRRREEDGRLDKYRAERRQREREQADPSEVFRKADIYERDGWACWLCSEPINRSAVWPEPDSASVDHVVPLSRGGGHTMANARAAHLRCNLVKSDREWRPEVAGSTAA